MVKKKFFVCLRVDGRFCVEVEAKNAAKAREAAVDAFYEADFGELSDIDAEARYVEDANGRRVWEDLD